MNTSHRVISGFTYLSVTRILIFSIGVLSFILVASGCSFRADSNYENLDVWDSRSAHGSARIITLADVVKQNTNTRVFFVGEAHTRYDHHLTQLEMLKTLYRQSTKLAIGVEWFQQPFQQHLDDYINGDITEEQMLHRTGYYNRWRYDYRLYRPILDFARQNKIRVLALNASTELSNYLKSGDLQSLPDNLKVQIPDSYDWSDKSYENRLREVFEMHPQYPGTFEQFLRGQLTWDEAMAYRAGQFLEENPDHRMVVFAGSGHIEHGSGIPNRITRHIDLDTLSLLPSDDFTDLDNSRAHYFIKSSLRSLPRVGLIGALLEEKDHHLIVKGFSDKSALRDAGLPEGIVIIGINDRKINKLTEFKTAMYEKRPGDTVKLHYLIRPDLELSSAKVVEITLR